MAGRPITFPSSTHIPLLELDSITPDDRIKIENYVRHTNMQHRQFEAQIQFMHRELELQVNKRLAEIAENTELKSNYKLQAKKLSELENEEESFQGSLESLQEKRRLLREENITLKSDIKDLKNEIEFWKQQSEDKKHNEEEMKSNEVTNLKGPSILGDKKCDKRKAITNMEDEEDDDESLFTRKEKKKKKKDTTKEERTGNFFSNASSQVEEPSDCVIF